MRHIVIRHVSFFSKFKQNEYLYDKIILEKKLQGKNRSHQYDKRKKIYFLLDDCVKLFYF